MTSKPVWSHTNPLPHSGGSRREKTQYWNTRQLQMQDASSLVRTPRGSVHLLPYLLNTKHPRMQSLQASGEQPSQHQTFVSAKFHSTDLTWRKRKEGGNSFISVYPWSSKENTAIQSPTATAVWGGEDKHFLSVPLFSREPSSKEKLWCIWRHEHK